MRVLVTGSSGQLGAEVARQLTSTEMVIGLDVLAGEWTTQIGDVADAGLIADLMRGVDVVIHIASLHAPHVGHRSMQDFIDTNITGTLRLLESIRILGQIIDMMPPGDYRIQDKKVTPPPRARIDESMEALIHHFKIFTEGFKVPEGEAYVGIEGPRGEIGCYIVSDGTSKPYRMHIRPPSFVNLQCLPHMMRGGLIADGVAIISSVDPILGEVDR